MVQPLLTIMPARNVASNSTLFLTNYHTRKFVVYPTIINHQRIIREQLEGDSSNKVVPFKDNLSNQHNTKPQVLPSQLHQIEITTLARAGPWRM